MTHNYFFLVLETIRRILNDYIVFKLIIHRTFITNMILKLYSVIATF